MLTTRAAMIVLATCWSVVCHADAPLIADDIDPDVSASNLNPPYRGTQGFRVFARDVERLNDRQLKSRGYPSFIKVDEIGAGHVQLVAHEQWATASLSDRQSSLQTMVNLLALRMAKEDGVTLLITDSSGIPLMKGSR